jgi:predicted kinase
MSQPKLIILTGIAGSGKSYLASTLSQRLSAIWISGDALRRNIFDDPKKTKHESPELYYDLVFRTIDYFAEQTLSSGHSFIYESQNNRDDIRKKLCELAERLNAVPVLTFVKTDISIARSRAASRTDGGHHIYIDPAKHHKSPDNFEEIKFTKKFITIDGHSTSEAQWTSFVDQYKAIWGEL